MKRTKFNVDKNTSKRTCDNIVFDSELEMRYYKDVLVPLVESGDILSFELQKPYELQQKFVREGKTVQPIRYVADFYIKYKNGYEEVIDIKGFPDSIAIMKRKMFWYRYPTINYRWIKWVKKYGGWIDYDQYKKLKREEKIQKGNKIND